MKREDALKLAVSVGAVKATHVTVTPADVILAGDEIVSFAALVEARTKERCAKVCDGLHRKWHWGEGNPDSGPSDCAKAIRALGGE